MTSLEQTWRWFGPKDPCSLEEIRQTGATGIVTALHHIPAGEVWPDDEILKRKRAVEAEGFPWSVAESVPVHEDIKKRTGAYQRFIENYKQSIRNLGHCGITTVCYNFMPVLDWARTDLAVTWGDGSITTAFESTAFAAFDLFILRRPDAGKGYGESQIQAAETYFKNLDVHARVRLIQAVLLGLPGSGEAYTLEGLRSALQGYAGMGSEGLRDNLRSFLQEIVPVAVESGVRLAIHPDDPPWPLLGLPRVVSTRTDIEQALCAVETPANGITLCTGSLGASAGNDVVGMTREFAGRINFVHLRNVSRDAANDFVESDHLGGDVDIYSVIRILLLEQKRRRESGETTGRIPMRPDHGHLMSADRQKSGIYPGYSLFGRMRGLAELRGMEMGISRTLGV